MFTRRSVLNRFLLSLLLFLVTIPFLAAQGQSADKYIGNATKPHTVVYKLKTNPGSQLRLATGNSSKLKLALEQVGAKAAQQKFPGKVPSPNARKGGVDLSLIYELAYHPSQKLEDVQRTLMATGMVEYVEPLYQRVPLYQPNDPSSDSTKTTQAYLKNIQVYGAWAVQKGDTNIVIGILDSGFRFTHEDIKNKIKYNYDDPIDGIDNDGDGLVDNFYGWDFADWDNNLNDDSPYKGHGTKVAGVAIGEADNNVGIAGVGFNTKFMPFKVFPSTPNGTFGGYEAIVHAADKGCSIINLSWGGEGFSNFEQDIINYAVLEKDVVIVAAAGNTNALVNIYPAAYNNVLAVGGTNNDIKTNGHTWNYKVGLTAPSQNVYSTTYSRDNSYGNDTGTSLASPIVAGAAALLRSQLPYLNAVQVMERLRVTSDDIYHLPGNAAYHELLGRGRLNVKRALKDVNAKSVRCTSFGLVGNAIAQVGDTMLVQINLTNYLDPIKNLQVRLTSSSPHVTILDDAFSVGGMATLATTGNATRPFRFIVKPGAPHNALIAFRLGFTDGTYDDFQYFQLPVNPDYITLTANNLHVTLNSKGNLGYNAYNFRQGVGITYKGSGSLLFEGGLMVASAADRISDNVRNASWQTDNDFVSKSAARLHNTTSHADQEIRGVMRDKFPAPGQAGVQVTYKGLALNDTINDDYIILEYRIQNITPDTIETLHAGLFADWNIGDPYLNAAEWDEKNKMGYVYNIGNVMPYAGIKLLTNATPSYYAIDNLAGGSSTFAIADGFSTQEKYRTLSGGVARKKAWGSGNGNDVSHVVGATIPKLAPGASQVIAFAIVAGDDLEALQEHAIAAQERYHHIRSGPAPIATTDTVCIGSKVMISPTGGSKFKFYADEAKTVLLATGASLELPALDKDIVLYISNADSLFESPLVPFKYTVENAPEAKFSVVQEQERLQAGQHLIFRNESRHGSTWLWSFGNGDTSTEREPSYTYPEPGTYEVALIAGNVFGCSDDTAVQRIDVLQSIPTAIQDEDLRQWQLYPNPALNEMRIAIPAGNKAPDLYMTDALGKRISPKLTSFSQQEAVYDLTGIAEGVYVVRISYKDNTLTKRLVVMRP